MTRHEAAHTVTIHIEVSLRVNSDRLKTLVQHRGRGQFLGSPRQRRQSYQFCQFCPAQGVSSSDIRAPPPTGSPVVVRAQLFFSVATTEVRTVLALLLRGAAARSRACSGLAPSPLISGRFRHGVQVAFDFTSLAGE